MSSDKLDLAIKLVDKFNTLSIRINTINTHNMSQSENNYEILSELKEERISIFKQLDNILFDMESKKLLIDIPNNNIEITKYVQLRLNY